MASSITGNKKSLARGEATAKHLPMVLLFLVAVLLAAMTALSTQGGKGKGVLERERAIGRPIQASLRSLQRLGLPLAEKTEAADLPSGAIPASNEAPSSKRGHLGASKSERSHTDLALPITKPSSPTQPSMAAEFGFAKEGLGAGASPTNPRKSSKKASSKRIRMSRGYEFGRRRGLTGITEVDHDSLSFSQTMSMLSFSYDYTADGSVAKSSKTATEAGSGKAGKTSTDTLSSPKASKYVKAAKAFPKSSKAVADAGLGKSGKTSTDTLPSSKASKYVKAAKGFHGKSAKAAKSSKVGFKWPTSTPSLAPTTLPSMSPSLEYYEPSGHPSSRPSSSSGPSSSSEPSSRPSLQPSSQPSTSSIPSSQPSSKPSSGPSSSSEPSSSLQPSSQPSTSSIPSSGPSSSSEPSITCVNKNVFWQFDTVGNICNNDPDNVNNGVTNFSSKESCCRFSFGIDSNCLAYDICFPDALTLAFTHS